jgi:tetratricopeptide (TPR) repeat protein
MADKKAAQEYIDAAIDEAKEAMKLSNFAVAIQKLEDLVSREPKEHEAWYFLAVCQRYTQQVKGAAESLQTCLEIDPSFGRAYQEFGHLYLFQGRIQEAIGAYLDAVRRNDSLVATWRQLIDLANQVGDSNLRKDAEEQYRRLSALPSALLGVRNFLAEGKLLKAESLCRVFLKQNPKHVEGMRLLADIGVKLSILDDAEFLLESALVFEPENPFARFDYINVLHQRQKYAQSLEQAQMLLAQEPSNDRYRTSMANQLVAVGRFEEALDVYDDIADRIPDSAAVQLLRGHALKTIGRLDGAVEAYRAAYRARPDFGDAYWSLANLKTYRFAEAEVQQMLAEQSGAAISTEDRIHLCFALGKACEDSERFEDAALWYERGNELKREDAAYDADRMTGQLSLQQEYCDASYFTKTAGSGCIDSAPIFIVGLPRAGSTLLEQILASHSQVDGTLELQNIPAIAHKLDGRRMVYDEPQYPKILHSLESGQAQALGEQYIAETQIHRQAAPYFIDKMPNNFRHIGLIKSILPNAKVIDARRHPMACCFSGYKQLFAEGQEFTYGLQEIGQYYRDYVELMDHWDTVIPGFVLRVQYEDVVDDLETQVRRILDFCGLEFEPSCVEFYKTKRSVRTPSSEQVRQPIYRAGVDQWRNFESYLDPLKAALGPMLQRYPIPE